MEHHGHVRYRRPALGDPGCLGDRALRCDSAPPLAGSGRLRPSLGDDDALGLRAAGRALRRVLDRGAAPTTDHRPPTTDHRPTTDDRRPTNTGGHGPPTTGGHRPPTTGGHGGAALEGGHGGSAMEGGHGGSAMEGGHGGSAMEGGHGGSAMEGGHGGSALQVLVLNSQFPARPPTHRRRARPGRARPADRSQPGLPGAAAGAPVAGRLVAAERPTQYVRDRRWPRGLPAAGGAVLRQGRRFAALSVPTLHPLPAAGPGAEHPAALVAGAGVAGRLGRPDLRVPLRHPLPEFPLHAGAAPRRGHPDRARPAPGLELAGAALAPADPALPAGRPGRRLVVQPARPRRISRSQAGRSGGDAPGRAAGAG